MPKVKISGLTGYKIPYPGNRNLTNSSRKSPASNIFDGKWGVIHGRSKRKDLNPVEYRNQLFWMLNGSSYPFGLLGSLLDSLSFSGRFQHLTAILELQFFSIAPYNIFIKKSSLSVRADTVYEEVYADFESE